LNDKLYISTESEFYLDISVEYRKQQTEIKEQTGKSRMWKTDTGLEICPDN
jgi:hypothetical protein